MSDVCNFEDPLVENDSDSEPEQQLARMLAPALCKILNRLLAEQRTREAEQSTEFRRRACRGVSIIDSVAGRWCFWQSPEGNYRFYHTIRKKIVTVEAIEILLAGSGYTTLGYLDFCYATVEYLDGSPYEELDKADGIFPPVFEWSQEGIPGPKIAVKPSPTAAQIRERLTQMLYGTRPKGGANFIEISCPPSHPPNTPINSIKLEQTRAIRKPFVDHVRSKLISAVRTRNPPSPSSPFQVLQTPVWIEHETARMLASMGEANGHRHMGVLILRRARDCTLELFKEGLQRLSSGELQGHYLDATGCFTGYIYAPEAGRHYALQTALSYELLLENFQVFEDWLEQAAGRTVDLFLEEYYAFSEQQQSNIGTGPVRTPRIRIPFALGPANTMPLWLASQPALPQPNSFLRKSALTYLGKQLYGDDAAP